jgi:hypothetical protein
VTDLLDLVDVLVLCGGLVVILWVGLQSSRPNRGISLPAIIGMSVWLAVFAVAIYLTLG